VAVATSFGHLAIFALQIIIFFIKNNCEQYENFEIKLLELQKFGKFGRCITKIETLEVELKIAPNFGKIKCNFPLIKQKSTLEERLTIPFWLLDYTSSSRE
jgi:hypothetical protein